MDSILPERTFHAGTVARGSKVHHTFLLVNRLNQSVRVADWRTKCGCTEVRVGAREIPPGTQTTIEAVLDTTRFLGEKRSGLVLILEQPSYAEVDLNFSCYIRGDISLSPVAVDFGIVPRASDPKPTVTMSLVYAGNQSNWGVTGMQTRGSHVSAKLQEQSRSPGGPVQYLLTATLDPSKEIGFFKDEITLLTNDGDNQTIPIAVSASIQAAVTISPSPLVLGPVKAGQTIRKKLLVRSSRPFKLAEVKPGSSDLTVIPDTEDAKAAHTMNLTLKVPARPGPFHAVVEIATDLKDEPPARLSAFATILP
ncbi:MAG: hypothetical protein NVSMB9_18770 [Isosphaeraceae bacterium]